MSAGTRNEAEALSASLRAKPLLLAALCVGAVVAAATTWATEKGQGDPERPDHVYVVTDDFVDYEKVIGRSGFFVRSATLREWEAEARQVLDDEELTGIEAVVALADLRGVGFLLVGAPAEVEGLEDLDLSSESDDVDETSVYASLSVGDLAFPHELRVNPEPSSVVELPGFMALEALLAQPRFDPEREILTHKPPVEELQLEERLSPGTKMVARARGLEKTVASIEAQIVQTRDAGGGLSLAGPLDSGGALPLPDGSFLTVVQRVELFSRDATTLEYRGGENLELNWRASLEDESSPCLPLYEGAISVSDHPRVSVSPDVATLMIDVDDEAPRIFRFSETVKPGTCPFVEVASLPETLAEGWESRWSAVPGQNMAARVQVRAGSSRLLVDPFVRAEGAEPSTRFDLPGVELGEPVWVGEGRLAALGRYWPEGGGESEDAIYLFDTAVSDRFTRVEAGLLGAGRFAQLAASSKGRLVLTAGPGGDDLLVVDLDPERAWPEAPEALEAPEPELSQPEAKVEGAPGEALREDALRVRMRELGGVTGNLGVTPDGTLVTFTHADSPQLPEEVAIVRIDDPDAQVELPAPSFVTNDTLRDVRPRLSADGRTLVFRTHVPVSVSDRFVSVPRAVVLSASDEKGEH